MITERTHDGVFWWHTDENFSPRITETFLARQRQLLSAPQYRREHENSWVSGADAFVTPEQIDAAMSTGWGERERGTGELCTMAVDIGSVKDPSVVGVGHRGPDGRIYVDRLVTLQGSQARPVQIADVEAVITDLADAFLVSRIRVESWQGLSTVQTLGKLGLPVELFMPTAKAQAQEWPLLGQQLAAHALVLPPHPRLREELLGLVLETGPTGAKVIDRGRAHQDHVVVVRMLVSMLQQTRCAFASCADPTCEGIHIWGSSAAPIVPRDVKDEQAEAAEMDRERAEASQRAIADAIRQNGWWTPGQTVGRYGR